MVLSFSDEYWEPIPGRVGSFWIECVGSKVLPPLDTGKEDADPCYQLSGKSYGGYRPEGDLRDSNHTGNMAYSSSSKSG